MQNTNDGFNYSAGDSGEPGRPAGRAADAARVAYLIQELDKWHGEGILAEDTYQGLRQRYVDEHQDIVRLAGARAFLEQARSARSQLRPSDALIRITQALELDPDSIELKSFLACVYEDLKRFDEAVSIYESLAAVCPDDAAIRDGFARAQQALEDRRQHEEQLATLSRIADMARAGQLDSAIEQCESFVGACPKLVDGHVLLATLYTQAQRIEEAIVQTKTALSIVPNDPRLQAQLASLENARARVVEAERQQRQRDLAEQMDRQRAARSQELTARAREAFAQSRLEEALNNANEAIALDSNNPAARAMSARVYSAQGLWEAAEQAWAAAAHLDPDREDYAAELQKASEARAYQQRSVWSRFWDKSRETVNAFMEERNVQWVHMLGAAILLAGVIGVSAWMVTVQKLWGTVGKGLAVTVPLIVTFAFYWIGRKLRPAMKTTATSFTGVASGLLPLDLIVAKHLFPGVFGWGWEHHLFVVSLVSTLVYAGVLRASLTKTMITFTGIGFLLANFFLMRSLGIPGPSGQGVWLAIIGFAYMLIACRMRSRGLSGLDTPVNILAHTAMSWALGSTLFAGSAAQTGIESTLNILVVSLAYLAAAYLAQEARYLPVFAAVLIGFVVLAMRADGLGIEQWYVYGLAFGVTGCLLLGMVPVSQAQDKDEFAAWYQWFGLDITAISVILALGKGLLSALAAQSLPSGPELLPSLITCLIVGVFYAAASVWTNKPRLIYGSALVFIYSVILALRLASTPTHDYPVWMMALAVIMIAAGWRLRRGEEERGQIVLNVGRVVAVVAGAVSVGLWAYHGASEPAYRDAAWLTALQAAAVSATAARFSRRQVYAATAIVSAAVWWGAGFSWLDAHLLTGIMGREVNYGLYYLPFASLLMWIRRALRDGDAPAMAVPFDAASLVLSGGALVLQMCLMMQSGPMLHGVWATLLAYSALLTWQSWTRREETLFGTNTSAAAVCAYLSLTAFWGAVFYVLHSVGFNRALTASAVILAGSVGASIAAYLLAGAARTRYVRVLLVSAGGVFAFGCCYGFFWDNPQAMLIALGAAVVYAIVAYSVESEILPVASMYGFGALYMAVCAGTYLSLQSTLPYPCIAMTALSGIVFVWLASRIRTRPPAYIATLSLFQAAAMLVFHLTATATIPGLHRVGFAGISALLLATAWILTSRREPIFAEAPRVVGFIVLSIDVTVALVTWLCTFSGSDRLIALIVTAAAAVLYGVSSVITRSRWYLWPAMLALSVAYGLAGAQWVMPHVAAEHANYGVWFWPLAAALAVGGHLLHRRQDRSFAWVLLLTSASLAVVSLSLQLGYSLMTSTIALYAYGLLLAWTAIAAREWSDNGLANALSQGAVYGAAALLGLAWLDMFEFIGASTSHLALYRSIAALTGVAWCVVGFRLSAWMSGRDWEWWARPLFWSVVVSGMAWNVWPVACGQSIYPLALAISSLTIVLYCWIALFHRREAFAYCGVAGFVLGYVDLFSSIGDFSVVPAKLVMFALAAVVAAISTGYASLSVRSRALAYISTFSACWAYFLLLHAGIEAVGVRHNGWYALGFAGFGLVLLPAFHALKKSGFEDLASAPALGSTAMTTIGALIASAFPADVGYHWTLATGTLALCAVSYALSAHLRNQPRFVYAACIAAAVGWGLIEWTSLLRVATVNYGLIYLPLVAAFGALAYAARGRNAENWARALWRCGFALSIVCGAIQLVYTDDVLPQPSVSLTLLLLAVVYAIASRMDRRITQRAEMLTYLSCASLLWCITALDLPRNLMLLIHPAMPFVYALLGISWAAAASYFEKRCWSVWIRPLLISAGVVQVIAAIYAMFNAGPNVMWWNVAALATATATFAWMAARFASRVLAYLANASAILAWYTLYLTFGMPSPTEALPAFGAWFGLLGVLMVGLGVVFDKKARVPELAGVEYAIGTALSSISAIAALLATPSARQFGEWTVAALLLGTIAHTTMAVVHRRVGFVHAGFLGVLISMYLVFYDRLNLREMDIYALPIGIYLIALPAISSFVGRKVRSNPYYSAGLVVILGSGLIAIAQRGWSSWNSYLMLAESVAAFLYGIAERRRAFFFFGSAFSAIWIAMLVRNSVIRQMHGTTLVAGIIGIIVGASLIVFASRSEQRRAELLDSLRSAVQSVREWE